MMVGLCQPRRAAAATSSHFTKCAWRANLASHHPTPPHHPPTHRPRVQGDGRYLISNGKDQTVKLWDLRRMATPAEAQRWRQDRVPHFSWDYR